MMNRRIMIIGAGGIGSFLTEFLQRLGYRITLWDDDGVERKNIGYQNFNVRDIGENKATTMAEKIYDTSFRGKVHDEPYKVLTAKQLTGYHLVVCCADNLAVRRLLYQQGFGDDAKLKWLDLRAQGRNAALISYKIDPNLMDAFLAGQEGSFSCQATDWDGSAKDINCMNIAIAGVAAQWIQRWFNNKDDVIDKMVLNV
jgi:molybdopterin/thiamine biosynthesis adenylyltransferase|tara:strand:- start:423 stop:1019 length:597 start_codon:yes stop_codon:yes gene_type:complete